MKITSFDEYKQVYKQSVEQPEEFWAGIADNFYGKKSGIMF
jgi:acetyl-CoA synthetase